MAIAIALEQNMRLACLALGGRQLRLLGELRLAYQLSEWIDRCLLGKTRTTRSKAATLLGPFRPKALLGLFAILFAIDLVLGCLRLDGRRRAKCCGLGGSGIGLRFCHHQLQHRRGSQGSEGRGCVR